MQNRKEKQKILLENKDNVEKVIDNILKKNIDEKTKSSRECMQILDLLYEIQPLLETVDESIKEINDDKLEQLYKTFRNLFKSFKSDVSETSQMINDGTFDKNDKISKEKMKQIKDRILNMKQELNNLKNKIFVPYKKYLVWIDQNVENYENQQYLQQFNNICNGAITVQSYTNNEDFRQFVLEHQDQMLYIIMSGKAAGDTFEGDGKNLAWVKQLRQQKPSSDFIYGIFIFTSYEGEQYFKPLIKSEKGLVLNVTCDPEIIFRDLQNIVFPKKSVRVLPVMKLCEYLDKELSDKFLQLAKQDYSKLELMDFHPDKPYKICQNFKFSELKKEEFDNQNLKKRLERAIQIIIEQKIGIDKDILDANEINQSLQECFAKKDNQQIAASILKLYTKETKFYRFLNSLLSVLNQDLIIIFWDLILCFRIALNIYDDSKFSAIQLPKKDINQQEERKIIPLYRGVPIPKEVFEQLYKPDQFISMCGFSSFSTRLDTALGFSMMGSGVNVIFYVEYQCGSQQYPLRPKCLIGLSDYDEEDIENSSFNGGALNLDQIQTSIQIQQSLFQNNSATQSGRAFYIYLTNQISFEIDHSSQITNNHALVGGGLCYLYPDTPFPQDYIPSNFPFSSIIIKNRAYLYGDNVASYLQKIEISQIIIQNDINKSQIISQNNNSSSVEFYEINNFQSRGKLLLRVILLDQAGRKLTLSKQNLIDQQYPPDIQNCQIGEIIQKINQNIVICQYCTNGTYSIADPNSYNNAQFSEDNYCKYCPQGSASCIGENIILQNGYWRINKQSECGLASDYCIGGQNEGCTDGHIGPLCQESDVYGIQQQNNARYTEGVIIGTCDICPSSRNLVFYIILMKLFITAYFFWNYLIFKNSFIYQQTCYYLRQLNILPINKSSFRSISGSYIKIYVNYSQLSSIVINNTESVPNLNIVSEFIGSFCNKVIVQYICLIDEQILKKYGKIGVQTIIYTQIPFLLGGLQLITMFIFFIFFNQKVKKYDYLSILNILLMYFQTQQTFFFAQSLSCVQIGQQSYSSLDLTQLCQSTLV
ncbi:hypothetical protein ABPG73_018945 [Tetrahymena malaccensis]